MADAGRPAGGSAPATTTTAQRLSPAHAHNESAMATKKAAEELTEPRPTVREAMRFGAFATAKLVAGAEGLDRPIEWVRMMETPEVQPRAGDLMLTTGFPIKDDRDAQVRR